MSFLDNIELANDKNVLGPGNQFGTVIGIEGNRDVLILRGTNEKGPSDPRDHFYAKHYCNFIITNILNTVQSSGFHHFTLRFLPFMGPEG